MDAVHNEIEIVKVVHIYNSVRLAEVKKPRDYTRLHKINTKSCGNLCNLVVPYMFSCNLVVWLNTYNILRARGC